MKNLKNIDCIALTSFESQQINGGIDTLKTLGWFDLSYIMGITVNGFVVFATEGGRNAGISVR